MCPAWPGLSWSSHLDAAGNMRYAQLIAGWQTKGVKTYRIPVVSKHASSQAFIIDEVSRHSRCIDHALVAPLPHHSCAASAAHSSSSGSCSCWLLRQGSIQRPGSCVHH